MIVLKALHQQGFFYGKQFMWALHRKHVMADIQISTKGKRGKLQTPRINFTPMVDLGFLLITFFVYTTTLAENKSIKVDRPDTEASPGVVTAYIDTSTITLIATANHEIIFYNGQFDENKLRTTNTPELRNIIIEKQKALTHLPSNFSARARELHVIIKPADECRYEDVVRIFDEMIINAVPHYVMVDITEEEKITIKRLYDN
jgi:biopolymer transport protein ExbD